MPINDVTVTPDNEPFVDLVQIRAAGSFGTGLLVGSGLVLTALHCVCDSSRGWLARENLGVYLLRDLWRNVEQHLVATVIWPPLESLGQHPADVAVLRIAGKDVPKACIRYFFGELPRGSAIGSARGFPKSARGPQLPGGRTEHDQPGRVHYTALSQRALTIDATGRHEQQGKDRWAGLSGGPLIVSGLIVGIMREVPDGWCGEAIQAEPLAPLLRDAVDSTLRDLLQVTLPLADPTIITRTDPFKSYLRALVAEIDYRLNEEQLAILDFRSDLNSTLRCKLYEPQALPLMFAATSPKDSKKFSDLRSAAKYFDDRLLLLGQPGSGKTVALLQCARAAAQERLADAGSPLPIVAPIAAWPSDFDQQPELATWLASLSPLLQRDRQALEAVITQGAALLILDGLDELRTVKRGIDNLEQVSLRMRFAASIPNHLRVIISCRQKDYAALGEKLNLNGAAVLQPLSKEQVDTMIRHQAPGLAELAGRPPLDDLIRAPLILGSLIAAFDDGEDIGNLSALSAGELRDATFSRLIKRRIMHEQARGGLSKFISVETIYRVLGQVAMLDAGGGGNQNAFFLSDVTCVEGEAAGLDVIAAAQTAKILFRESDLLRFSHMMIRDHFAFREAMRVLNDETESEEARDSAAWSIWQVPDPRAISTLIRATYDVRRYVRGSAIGALARIGDPSAIPRLNALLADKTPVASIYGNSIGEIAAIAIDIIKSGASNLDKTYLW